jgi:hypothetical protein
MDCVAWMADMINTHIDLIGQEERWYEDMAGNNLSTKISTVLFTRFSLPLH